MKKTGNRQQRRTKIKNALNKHGMQKIDKNQANKAG
jgi:hypothetical protein